MSFELLGLKQKTLQAIADEGYQTPTPIQEQVIPLILKRLDVFGIAQTGTGKTASYCLPLLDLMDQSRFRARLPRALILAPTRELALQIRQALDIYGRYYQLKVAVVIGGESAIEQERALNKGVDIVIATPGRLLDTLNRGKVMLSAIEFLVIDEADRMLDMGFIPDIEKILTFMVKKHQSLLFSATVSEPIRKLIGKFRNNPVEVFITPSSQTAETIEQFQVRVTTKQKREALRHLISTQNVQTAIVFCNRKKDVSTLCTSLQRHGFKAGMIHGDLTQGARTETLDAFKKGELNFLVASDVAARGLDIDDLAFVFNFDAPSNAEEYVHRIGRTGRAGRSGKAFTLVGEEDIGYIAPIEKLIGKEIPVLTLGEEFNVSEKRTRTRSRKPAKTHKDEPVAVTESVATPVAEEIKPETARPKKAATPRRQTAPREPRQPVKGFGDEVPAFFHLSWASIITQDSTQPDA